MGEKVTLESFRRERDRREREREKLAIAFECAALIVEEAGGDTSVVLHLRYEARRWRGTL